MSQSPDLTGYTLTYDDEFSSPSSFAWSPDGSSGYQTTLYNGDRTLWSNSEQEMYSDSTVGVNPFAVAGGELTITAAPGTNSLGLPYNSGLLSTEGMFNQQWGYFEIRAEVAQGAGMWSEFYLLPTDKSWPPEVDPLEAFGAFNPQYGGGSNMYHWGTIAPARDTQSAGAWYYNPALDIYSAYHTYGVDVEPDKITWYLDGQAVANATTPDGYDKSFYMIMALAVGGWSGNPTGETGVYGVDYLRAYSKDADAHAVALQTISSPDGADTTPIGAITAGGDTGGTGGTGGGGTTTSALTVRVSEDAWNGDAQFVVTVDGVQMDGTLTATGSHALGEWQDIAIAGAISAGPHTIGITFLNDAWGGSADTDRNLYVQSVTINDDTIPYTQAHDDASANLTASDSVVLAVDGTASFSDATSGGTGGTGGGGTTTGALSVRVSEDAWNGDAQFTVSVDGQQIGGVQTVTASHAAGQWQDITLADSLAPGPHNVAVNFINDAWGGTASTDRNMYVQSISVNGETISGTAAHDDAANGNQAVDPTAAVMDVNGTALFQSSGTTGTTTSQTSGIVLHVSEDAWNGDAQFLVFVDGTQVGGTQTATASHAAGQVQDITLTGDFGSQGPGTVDIQFVNDAWGGSADTDRNLYVQSLDVNGVHFAGNTADDAAANGNQAADPSAAVMDINGIAEFHINHTAPPDGLFG